MILLFFKLASTKTQTIKYQTDTIGDIKYVSMIINMHPKNNIKNTPINRATIESLSHDGRGIAHINNKITFIENALPTEEVNFIYTKQHSKFNSGKASEILVASMQRIQPECKYYDICGGCTLQHLAPHHQLSFKTKVVQEHLKHIGNLEITNFLPPLTGPTSGYRYKARVAVKYVQKKQKVLVGFHEKNGSYIADIDECPILHPNIGKKIHLLGKLIATLSIYQHIPQIEIACSNEVTALVFRHLQKFSEHDIKLLTDFGTIHQLHLYSQSGGADSIKLINPNQAASSLYYQLPSYNLKISFSPLDFTQINPAINMQMVDHVRALLDLKPTDRVLDLFCGIGNFTLPLATKCAHAIGIEGNKHAVSRAQQNAQDNKLCNIEFYTADLTQPLPSIHWSNQSYDKIVLDPPRSGALEIVHQLKKFGAKKIIYVSCNPATFARDAKIITTHGYKLQSVTVADMYPHTSHIEIISEFS